MELDDAFANMAHIPDGAAYPERWAAQAAAFRDGAQAVLDQPYGSGAREVFDLFLPLGAAKGVVIFVHGGYWLRFDKSYWSHLAAGPLAQSWAVAMPSYDLCPTVRIGQITDQIGQAIRVIGDRVPGPIRLAGHSAGGQLVAMHADADRVAYCLPISPVADLAPLMRTSMNADLRIDKAEAQAQSPVHLPPPNTPVTAWVGADERPVFVEQARALADAWQSGLVIDPGKHHFDVIDGLAQSDSPITRCLLGLAD